MTTERRKKSRRGQEIIEFGLVAVLYVPLLTGGFVVGMNLIRSIECNQTCRDLTDMFIHGADFSTYQYQQLAQKLAGGLNLQIGSSFSGNEQSNTGNSGNGLVTVTEIMYVGTTSGAQCQSVAPATCTNANSFVYLSQVQFGNSSLANSNTVTLGTCPSAVMNSAGIVQNPITASQAQVGSSGQSAMSSLWQSGSNGTTALTDGQTVYIVETYFQSPDLSIGSFAGNGVYARYFF
ncbi:MAG TPA: hypothetical protein VMB25_21245 [Bryobacteraceae bacterium]|nr:hypothetical protein [Bryobacteraceae bacterium]